MAYPKENESQDHEEKIKNRHSALAFIKADEEITKDEERENTDLRIAKGFPKVAQQTAQQAIIKGLNNDLYK